MQSKTLCSNSYFNRALARRNLSRFWPLWAVYAVAWLVMGPLVQFIQFFGDSAQYNTAGRLASYAREQMLGAGTEFGVWMALIFGCLFAMALFSYLYSARSVGMMHAFPIRREGLFLTNYLSGAAVFTATLAVTATLMAAVQAAAGALDWALLGQWLACTVGEMLLFYSLAVFCAMFTGQLLALPVFYGVLNGLAVGVTYLVQTVASGVFYGYTGGGIPKWVAWLTPIYRLHQSVWVTSTWNVQGEFSDHFAITGLSAVGIYAAAGVSLAVLAALVCRRRASETAGDIVAIPWARHLFRYGVAVCCALSLGQLLYLLVWEQMHRSALTSVPALAVCMTLTGLVGYFAAEMLLKKSFRVLRSGWKGAAVLTAALILFGVGAAWDVTGVEARVPSGDAVESLSVSIGGQNHCGGTVTDPVLIDAFRAVHQTLVGEKDETLARMESDESFEYGYLSLEYQLKNGGVLRRNYNLSYRTADLASPDTAVAQLAALVVRPELQRLNLLGTDQSLRITGGEFSYPTNIRWENDDSVGWSTAYLPLDTVAAQKLYDAVAADIDAGHFGINQFDAQTWSKETYVNRLELYCTNANGDRDSRYLQFSSRCTNLLAALKAVGAISQGTPLMTEAELNSRGALAYEEASVPLPADTLSVSGGAAENAAG